MLGDVACQLSYTEYDAVPRDTVVRVTVYATLKRQKLVQALKTAREKKIPVL